MGSFFGFDGFNIMFNIVLILILCMVVFMIVQLVIRWSRNNHSPRLTVNAAVTSKRTDVTHHHSSTSAFASSTLYYVTFQVESGDRIELNVTGYDYGMLAEGDRGRLSFQGTRFLGFERTM